MKVSAVIDRRYRGGILVGAREAHLQSADHVPEFGLMSYRDLPSPSTKVRGIVYFARMLKKIRAHAGGTLPSDYQPNLGKGFDGSCVKFLQVNYSELAKGVKQGGSDEDLLEWCFANGHRPSAEEIFVWNEFMRKRGWHDDVTETLVRRKREANMSGRDEIQSMFDFIDADEGRAVQREPSSLSSVVGR